MISYLSNICTYVEKKSVRDLDKDKKICESLLDRIRCNQYKHMPKFGNNYNLKCYLNDLMWEELRGLLSKLFYSFHGIRHRSEIVVSTLRHNQLKIYLGLNSYLENIRQILSPPGFRCLDTYKSKNRRQILSKMYTCIKRKQEIAFIKMEE